MWLDYVSVFFQKFLEIVLPVLATLLAGLVIAWVTKVVNDIKSKLTAEQKFYIETAVKTAVMAAEQVKLVDQLIDKKKYALDVATDWLNKLGIKVDLKVLDSLIEAAVFTELNREKTTTTTTTTDFPQLVTTVTKG